MKTNDLIKDLSGRLEPVQPRSFAKRLAMTIALGFAYLALLFVLFHSRPDLTLALHSPEFLALQTILITAAALSLAYFARMEVPGTRLSAPQVLLLAGFAFAAILLLVYRYLNPNAESLATAASVSAFHCATTVAIASAVLAAGLLWMARAQAPTQPFASGTLAVLASVAIGSLAVDLSCPNNHPLHLLFFHLLAPCLAVLAVFLPFARRFLSW